MNPLTGLESAPDGSSAGVGGRCTRLLAGPGAIVASMLFVQRIHNGAQVAAFWLALCAVIVVLWLAVRAFVKQG